MVDAVGDEVEVLADGGVRTGLDVVKMVALGARAVLVGRPWAWAVAARGQAGVRHMLEVMRADIDTALGLTGQTSIAGLDRSALHDQRAHRARSTPKPTGAQALIRTLVDAGVTTCFTNPGTSEMHFVAALDSVPEMRAVLALFEGVATGAADGYARMADRPGATLLHLGPGPRQRPREPVQRAQGQGADRQHRRRPRDLPHAVRRPAPVGHRDRRPQRVHLGAHVAEHGRWRTDAAEAIAAAHGPPGSGRDADPARRRVLVRGRRARCPAGTAPAADRAR